MIVTNDVVTAVNTLQLALNKMAPNSRAATSKSGLMQVQSLINLATNQLGQHHAPDLLQSELLTLSQLLETIINSTGFVETDANGKSLIVNAIRKSFVLAAVFACEFYSVNEFSFYPGLQPILTEIVKVGVAHNFNFE